MSYLPIKKYVSLSEASSKRTRAHTNSEEVLATGEVDVEEEEEVAQSRLAAMMQ